mmetsp:Transcript_26457/g.48450  ORF Transcript_26457/g.48450 Transcript_26457/m.48450 type:complete len:112 (-) Transcript_26457:75-410(-)
MGCMMGMLLLLISWNAWNGRCWIGPVKQEARVQRVQQRCRPEPQDSEDSAGFRENTARLLSKPFKQIAQGFQNSTEKSSADLAAGRACIDHRCCCAVPWPSRTGRATVGPV